jgi:L,D-peptidoglycan transpeptidase YkuD (ErfK/YbiS/YcfS/YnhG family)
MKKIVFLLLGVSLCAFASQSVRGQLPTDPQQLVVVRTSDWDAVAGTLETYQWNGPRKQWEAALPPIPIVVGQKGLAWGAGLHDPALAVSPPTHPRKREGDRKAPAGVFRIESAYAYSRDAQMAKCQMPLTVVNQTTLCVDDARSGYYNQIIGQDTASRRDWQSAEEMRRADVLYKYGLVVGYNTGPATQAGNGSCIFIHIWSGASKGTMGCTAMTEANLVRLMQWLDPTKRPVLVQAPRAVYQTLAQHYRLPE